MLHGAILFCPLWDLNASDRYVEVCSYQQILSTVNLLILTIVAVYVCSYCFYDYLQMVYS